MSARKAQCRSWGRIGGVAAVMMAAALSAVGAEQPAVGTAKGSFIVDGKPFSFAHAYARVEQDPEGKEVLWVLLTEKPLTAEHQAAPRLRDVMASGDANGMAFALDPQNAPSDWHWNHPALSIGCALCSDLKFKLTSRSRDAIAGSVVTAKPQTWKGQKYEFQASFSAKIASEAEPKGSKAQKEAQKKLKRMGLAFTAADFFMSRTQPDAIRLFLDAGMPPDTLPPGGPDTLLIDVLGSDCEEPQVRAVALMLIAAGADPNRRSSQGGTPLLGGYRCADVVAALLDAGADMKAPSPIKGESVGQTLMGNAITFDRTEVVRLLIARGYDVKREGAALLQKARGQTVIEQLLRDAGAVAAPKTARKPAVGSAAPAAAKAARAARTPEQARQELEGAGTPFTETQFWNKLTVLETETVLLFLDAGMSPNLRRSAPQSDTPLLFVTQTGCATPPTMRRAAAEIALALIAHKGDVNARSGINTTPVMNAAEACPAEVVRALLKAGADTKVKSRGGASAMALAVMSDREDNVRALIDGGYDVKGELAALLPLAAGKPKIEALLKQGSAEKRP